MKKFTLSLIGVLTALTITVGAYSPVETGQNMNSVKRMAHGDHGG
ncbi:hypothetical protein [Bacillus manliponensis]